MMDNAALYQLVFVFLGALCIGSFLTMLTHRLPREDDIIFKRSHCPSCSTPLRARDLFPFFSWAWQRGKCRYCKTHMHWRYPAIELVTALLLTALFWYYGNTLQGWCMMGLGALLIAMIVIDFEHYIIPDSLQIAMGVLALCYHFFMQKSLGDVMAAGILGLGIGLALVYGYRFWRKKDGLGFGDVKFLLVAGLWLADPLALVPFLFYAGVLGVLTAGLWNLLSRGAVFPFGPALALSLFLCLNFPIAVTAFFEWPHWLFFS